MEGQRIFVKRVREEVNENQGQNRARGQVVGNSVFEGRFCKKGNLAIERAWWSQRAGRGEVEPVQAGGASLPRGRRSKLGAGACLRGGCGGPEGVQGVAAEGELAGSVLGGRWLLLGQQ